MLLVRTQPGGEVTTELFVSVALQPDVEMTNCAAAGGAQRSIETYRFTQE